MVGAPLGNGSPPPHLGGWREGVRGPGALEGKASARREGEGRRAPSVEGAHRGRPGDTVPPSTPGALVVLLGLGGQNAVENC